MCLLIGKGAFLITDMIFATHLLSKEAHDFMVLHWLLFFLGFWLNVIEFFYVLLHELLVLRRNELRPVGVLLHEPHHCPVALRHELLVECLLIFKLKQLAAVHQRVCFLVFHYLWLDVVPEIGKESSSWLELNVQSLVVKDEPLSLLPFRVWLAWGLLSKAFFVGIRAVFSHYFLTWKHHYFPNVLFTEVELKVLSYCLYFIRKLMSANLLCLKQIDLWGLLTNMKIPNPLQLLRGGFVFWDAMNR